MATIQLSSSSAATIYDRPALQVQVKRYWSDNWQTVDYLEPQSATLTIAPATPQASFVYRYGQIKREDSNDFEFVTPLNLANWYVRILSDGATLFVGILMDEHFDLMGALSGEPAGDQSMTAYGLEHLLDRVTVWGAQTASGRISRTPAFNRAEQFGGLPRGNRSASSDSNGVYVFDDNDATWSHLDILNYVFTHHASLGFSIGLSGQYSLLADLSGVYTFEGLTLRQILDKLIDRRRGLGWLLWSDGFSVSVHVFTVFENDVSFSDVYIPGNPDQIELDTDGIDVESARISLSQAPLYDTIVVQGARAKTCFTVSLYDGNLQSGWDSALENAYKNAADDAERKTDKYNAVYQRFIIPSNWNGAAGNGIGGYQSGVLPAFDDAANIVSGESVAINLNSPLLRQLPLVDGNGDFIAPLVVGAVVDGADTFFFQIDKKDDYHSKAVSSVRMLDDVSGLQLNPSINHALALGSFDPDTYQTDVDPEISYQGLLATVAVETDTRPTVVVSVGGETETNRTLVLTVHDAEFWWLNENTVTGVTDNDIDTAGGFALRDDTDKLRKIAALAQGWYGKYRGAVEMVINDIVTWASLGSLVTSASSSWHREPVGTVVSSIQYDFIGGKTAIQTGHAELDLAAVLDIPGMSDFRSVGRAFNRMQSEIKGIVDRLGFLPVRNAAIADGGGGETYPGVIVGKTSDPQQDTDHPENVYDVTIYKNGLGSAATTEIVECEQLNIDSADTIPAGYWVMVSKVNNQYYMQAPVWG